MNWITAFFMAWGMFWIVPCPVKRWDENGYERMLLCFPLIGLLCGGVWAVLAWLRARFCPGFFGAALLALIPYGLTGFIHVDGYMDCADAVCSRRDRETRLKILKDPHVGTFAAAALAVLLLLMFALFAESTLEGKRLCLLFVSAVPRACMSCAVLTLPPLEHSSYAKMFKNVVKKGYKAAAVSLMAVLIVLPVLLFGRVGLCGLVGAAGAWAAAGYIRHDLGGMSGDVSGAGVTVGELCALAALVLL